MFRIVATGNPHLKKLNEIYRAIAFKCRDGDRISCHVPNDPDKMKRPVLSQAAALAAAEIECVTESVRDGRMPLGEFGIDKPLPTDMKGELPDVAQSFAGVQGAG